MRWCSSSRRGVGANLKGVGVAAVELESEAEDMAAMEPHVSGGAPSSLGDGEGASATKEYPFTLGVSAPLNPEADDRGLGFPAIASRTVENDGEGGGPGSAGGGMRVFAYTTDFGGSSFSPSFGAACGGGEPSGANMRVFLGSAFHVFGTAFRSSIHAMLFVGPSFSSLSARSLMRFCSAFARKPGMRLPDQRNA